MSLVRTTRRRRIARRSRASHEQGPQGRTLGNPHFEASPPPSVTRTYEATRERFGQEAYRHHPYPAQDAAEFLVDRKVSIVGTDTITPDVPVVHRGKGFNHPIHRQLLKHDVLIVEHLGPGLREVVGQRLLIATLPLRIVGGDGSPIAACAFVDEPA